MNKTANDQLGYPPGSAAPETRMSAPGAPTKPAAPTPQPMSVAPPPAAAPKIAALLKRSGLGQRLQDAWASRGRLQEAEAQGLPSVARLRQRYVGARGAALKSLGGHALGAGALAAGGYGLLQVLRHAQRERQARDPEAYTP